MESLPKNTTGKFFPVFMSIGVLMISLVFYNVVGTTVVTNTSDVLGASTVASREATLIVKSPREVRTYTDIAFASGDTTLDFLTCAEDSTSFAYSAERYDFGWYVHTVNGRRALNNEFWNLIVNGEDWNGLMEEYKVQPGDVIELVLEEL